MTALEYCNKSINVDMSIVWHFKDNTTLTENCLALNFDEMRKLQNAQVVKHKIIKGVEHIYLDIPKIRAIQL